MTEKIVRPVLTPRRDAIQGKGGIRSGTLISLWPDCKRHYGMRLWAGWLIYLSGGQHNGKETYKGRMGRDPDSMGVRKKDPQTDCR